MNQELFRRRLSEMEVTVEPKTKDKKEKVRIVDDLTKGKENVNGRNRVSKRA